MALTTQPQAQGPTDPRLHRAWPTLGAATKAKAMDAYRKEVAKHKAQYGPRS